MRLTALAWLVAGALSANASAAEPADMNNDPHLWLEDVEGEKALDWVRARNAVSEKQLAGDPGFERMRKDILDILDSDARIPYVSKRGEYYYNFWRDKQNPQGVWRRTTLAEYRKDAPQWEVLLDIDALGKAEGVNWVWGGANCLRPEYDRCLIALSRGGADATVTREFDVSDKAFVEGGFSRPEAKGQMGWIDIDTVYIGTDFGPGSMTSSGYARIAKEWKRGTPMAEAKVVFEGKDEDISVGAYRDDTPGYERDWVYRGLTFYTNELYLRGKDGSLTKLDLPDGAQKGVFREWLTVELRQPWEVKGTTHPAGSLLAINFDDFMKGGRDFEVVFAPTENSSLASSGATKDYFFINVLEDVKNRIYVLTPDKDGWKREPLVGAPEFGTVSIGAVDADESNEYFMTVADYLTPTSLLMGEIGKKPEVLKQLPAFFDASPYRIEQHFATSKDGTRVPYFMVSRKDLELDGDNPTLLYGYGGFEVSYTPWYSGAQGRAWTGQGGVFVLANIRGGGEFGPNWHQAALQENRHRAHEDYQAVAMDLIARGVTSQPKLGIMGGSQGGLFMGAMLTQRPDLINAAVIQVPLFDMLRFHRLLAGASWIAEYGNPDIPEERAWIQQYSPYQNLRAGQPYPEVFIHTSTKDDRVHPGHARKAAARLEELGYPVLFYENTDGGHAAGANLRETARRLALEYTYLTRRLMDSPAQQ